MGNLPLDLRRKLAEEFALPGVEIKKKLVSSLDNTVKYLYGLPDGETVESVLMQYKHGWSQCLSTQVGCRMGLRFLRDRDGRLCTQPDSRRNARTD